MKKNHSCYRRRYLKHIALVLLFYPLSALGAQGHISIKGQSITIMQAIQLIEKNSDYTFFYNAADLEDKQRKDINCNGPIDEILDEVFKDSGISYIVKNKEVILNVQKTNNTQQKKKRTVTGTIIDAVDDSPIIGANITIKGDKNTGTISDIDGNFSLNVPEGNDLLLISFVGMETLEVNLKGKTMPLDVVLKPKADELDEVVVTGYTQTTKRRSTGSVGIIKKEVFENRPVSSVDNLLQGQIAGVSVLATSGRPGASSKIRIRGTNTLTGNAEPLWVVDGVPLQKDIPDISAGQIKSGDFDNIFTTGLGGINPNDIESVTVLKDASAAAIYGSRAAGGVIVVTTKQGKAGKMKVNYSANVSIVLKPQRDMNLMNSREKLAWEQELWDEFSAKGFNSGTYYPVVGIVGMIRSGKDEFKGMSVAEQDAYIEDLASQTTDWVDILFRNSFSMSHHLSLSGGKEEFTYYLSFGYSKRRVR